MARSITQIQNQIIANIQGNATLSGLTSASNAAIWRLLTWIVAVAINLLEQLTDIFTTEIEGIASSAITGNAAWLRQQVLNFQFGYVITINPQTFAPSYTVIDTSTQVVQFCSVTIASNNIVNVKVAGVGPAPISSPQEDALNSYLTEINFAGVGFNLINDNPDRLYIQATIYYNGQYVNVIQANVIAALTAYCTALSNATNFDGEVKVSAIEQTILGVAGVEDVDLINVYCRPVGASFGSGLLMVTGGTLNYLNYTTAAGYIIPEDTSGETFANSLTFTIQ